MLYKYKSDDSSEFESEANRLNLTFEIPYRLEDMKEHKTYVGIVVNRDDFYSERIGNEITRGYKIGVTKDELEYCKLKEQKIKLKDLV